MACSGERLGGSIFDNGISTQAPDPENDVLHNIVNFRKRDFHVCQRMAGEYFCLDFFQDATDRIADVFAAYQQAVADDRACIGLGSDLAMLIEVLLLIRAFRHHFHGGCGDRSRRGSFADGMGNECQQQFFILKKTLHLGGGEIATLIVKRGQ